MKSGGNESATKYFQSHGGSAALASKDPKTKYQSNAATKYKEELTRRVAIDVQKYPDQVIITDLPDSADASNGNNTPSLENEDDFFSSWDKPTIKRPSNPPSRTATPSQQGRASPFLNPPSNGNSLARPKSPLAAAPSAAVRKIPATGAAIKKTNILGAKKTKLGAKKVSPADDLDFEAAEKKAKDEAERIEKLGYDPDADSSPAATKTNTADISAPTPISPRSGSFGANTHNRAASQEVERLGMGMGRLGFGQMGAKAAAPVAPAQRTMGFGSAGTSRSKAVEDAETTARNKFGQQKGISSDEFFGRNQFDPNAQTEAKTRLQGFEGATSISSNAYFGRSEDEGAVEDYGDLESAAKDFVRKFGITAGDDLDNVSQLLGEGASRLQGKLNYPPNCYILLIRPLEVLSAII